MEKPIAVENRGEVESETFAALSAVVSGHRSIKNAVDWLSTMQPPRAPSEMVTQDEYSHDVLVPLPEALWLVYDCT